MPFSWHAGEENGRIPVKLIVEPSIACVVPLGRWKVEIGAAGSRVMVYWLSSRNGPQLAGDPNEVTSLTVAEFNVAICMMSRQVCGVARLRSVVASKRCPCEPT